MGPAGDPSVVIRPIRFPNRSVNQRAPSGPPVMPLGPLPVLIPAENTLTAPAGVALPITPAPEVNHRFPSGPAAIPGRVPTPLTRNSVTAPAG